MNAQPLSGRRVLVTGATGFIGSRLCTKLASLGAEVHGVRRSAPPDLPGVRWAACDLAEYAATRSLLDAVRPDTIFHLAGHVFGVRQVSHVLPTFRSNLASTVHVLTAAAEIGSNRVILTGSQEEPDMTNLAEVPSSPYAVAKWASSAYARLFYALFQIPVVTLRVFMVYGPGQRDLKKLIPYTILTLLQGERPKLSSGTRLVDWIYVDDVVDAYIAAALTPELEGRTIEVGSGRLVSVREIVETLVRIVNPELQPLFGAVPERPMEQVRVADVEAATRATGWRPEVALEDGLRRTAQWYEQRLREARLPEFLPLTRSSGGAVS